MITGIGIASLVIVIVEGIRGYMMDNTKGQR